MYYSIVDNDSNYVLSCGMNSSNPNEIKKALLKYIKPYLEGKREYILLKNSDLHDLMRLYRFRLFAHSYKFTKEKYMRKISEVLG